MNNSSYFLVSIDQNYVASILIDQDYSNMYSSQIYSALDQSTDYAYMVYSGPENNFGTPMFDRISLSERTLDWQLGLPFPAAAALCYNYNSQDLFSLSNSIVKQQHGIYQLSATTGQEFVVAYFDADPLVSEEKASCVVDEPSNTLWIVWKDQMLSFNVYSDLWMNKTTLNNSELNTLFVKDPIQHTIYALMANENSNYGLYHFDPSNVNPFSLISTISGSKNALAATFNYKLGQVVMPSGTELRLINAKTGSTKLVSVDFSAIPGAVSLSPYLIEFYLPH